MIYKHLERISVKPNIPNPQSSTYTPRRFRTSKDICKYDCAEEEAFLQSNSSESASPRLQKRNSDLVKSLSELGEVNNKFGSPKQRQLSTEEKETQTKIKAENIAEVHLGTEDAVKFLAFLDYYVELSRDGDCQNLPDEMVVKAFGLFKGDVAKSMEFLRVAGELEELGFESEKVVSALLLHSNDREAALDFLMKN